MFLDNIDYNKVNEWYLNEAYAKGSLASDYISKIRTQCNMMTYVPGFDRVKIKRIDSLIEKYEDNLKLAKQELEDYRSKSKNEQEKIERLNKIDTILSTSIKISVIILTTYLGFSMGKAATPKIVDSAQKIIKSKKIIGRLLRFPAKQIISNANKISKVSKGYKVAKTAMNSIEEIGNASNTVKMGGYEAEIVKCIREMEQLLDVLKKKKSMFERELDKKEKGIR